MQRDTIKFSRTARNLAGSVYFAIPKEILEYLGIKVGDELTLIPLEGKHGKYAAFWKKEDKKEEGAMPEPITSADSN